VRQIPPILAVSRRHRFTEGPNGLQLPKGAGKQEQKSQDKKRRVPVVQRIQTMLMDDLDGTPAEATVRFGLDGTDFEIDLNAGHDQALHDLLAPYVKAARRVSSTQRPSPRKRTASTSGPGSAEIRDWAKKQGIEVKDRGRIPAELVVRFKAATAA
jgi:hypothetical protein